MHLFLCDLEPQKTALPLEPWGLSPTGPVSAFETWHLLSWFSGQLASYPLGLPRAPAGTFYLSGLTTWRTGSAGSQTTKLQVSAGHKLANQLNLLLGSWLKLPWEEEES